MYLFKQRKLHNLCIKENIPFVSANEAFPYGSFEVPSRDVNETIVSGGGTPISDNFIDSIDNLRKVYYRWS